MDLRTISDIQALNSGLGAQGKSDLDQGDFMKLMLAQMKHQDPFKPLDNAEFLGQMAQFSTVSGINEINQSMGNLADSLASSQMLNAATLVDKSALVASNSLKYGGSGGYRGQVELPVSSSGVHIEIVKPNGETARRLALGPQAAGAVNYQWDGRDANGAVLPAGTYSIRASYFDGNKQEALDHFIHANIDSVSLPTGGGSATVELEGLGHYKISDIKSIS